MDRRSARRVLRALEEGGHADLRLGGGGIAASPIACDVLVIGGGATGAGVVRDAAMRGFRAVLVERAISARAPPGASTACCTRAGATSRQGSRSRRPSAPRRTPSCAGSPSHGDRGHRRAVRHHAGRRPGVRRPVPGRAATRPACRSQEIPTAEALAREPRLNPGITRAFERAGRRGRRLEAGLGHARSARGHGARILTYHWVTEVLREGDRVGGARVRDDAQRRGGATSRPRFVINAAGAWAGRSPSMAGCHGVTVVPGKGIMIAMNHRLV